MVPEDQSAETGRSYESWQQVGEQFEALGASLASAVQTAWADEGNRQAVREVESGLRSLASAVAVAVDEAAASPEGQQVRAEAERAVASAQEAGRQAADQAVPQLASALRALGEGLRSALSELQRSGPDDKGD